MLIMIVKSIHDLIGISHKTVNGINRVTVSLIKGFNTLAKGGTVPVGYQFAGFEAGLVIQLLFSIHGCAKITNSKPVSAWRNQLLTL